MVSCLAFLYSGVVLQDLCHKISHSFRRLILHLSGGMGVGAEGKSGVIVSQHIADGFYVHTVLEGQGCETLYQGTTYVDSWSGSGKGYASVSGSCGVRSGKSYKLVLTYSINGSSKPSVSTTATCP